MAADEPTLLKKSGHCGGFETIIDRFREVWALLGAKEKRYLCLSLLPMILHSAAQSAILILGGSMVDRLEQSQTAETLSANWWTIAWTFLSAIGLCALAREAFGLARKRMVSAVTSRLERNLTIGTISHIFRQSLQTLSKEHVGAFHGKAMRGIAGFTSFIKLTFRDFLPVVVAVLVSLGYAIVTRPMIGCLMLVALISTMTIIAWQLSVQRGMYGELAKSREQLDGRVIEQLEGMEYIRAANTLNIELHRITQVADHREQANRKLWLKSASFDIIKSLNEWGFYLGTLALTVYMASHGMIRIGEILAYVGLMTNMLLPLREMHRILDEGHDTAAMLKDLMGLMDQLMDPSFMIDEEREMTLLKRFGKRRPEKPKIDFVEPILDLENPLLKAENLVVEVGEGEGRRKILDRVTLSIKKGETIGFAGPSGSGKSTLLKALMRLLPIQSGILEFGSVPIEKVSRDSIGSLIGYVSQSPFVFAGTVAENIAYGCDNVTMAAIQEASKKAGVHDDILAMVGGYNAILLERGSNLSGGQRQRIAIARIFLKNPPILILDEGTSALDNVSEQIVQKTLDELRGNHTILLVAHRLSTLQNADRIIVFERGKVVQTGSLGSLENQPGVFQDLMKKSAGFHS